MNIAPNIQENVKVPIGSALTLRLANGLLTDVGSLTFDTTPNPLLWSDDTTIEWSDDSAVEWGTV